MPWRTILNSGAMKWGGGILIGIIVNTVASFAPDAFWVHDNRQAISLLISNQPLIQRDISDLKTALKEVNISIKELTVAIQNKQVSEENHYNKGKH